MPERTICPICQEFAAKVAAARRKHRQLELQRADALRDNDWEAADDFAQALRRATTAIADAVLADQKHRTENH